MRTYSWKVFMIRSQDIDITVYKMNFLVYLSILEIFHVTLLGATDCPDLWIPYDGTCYLFAHQNYSFVEAEHFCLSYKDGNLLHLNTQEENVFIKDHITYLSNKWWWIGLTDDDIEGLWAWNGSDETPTFKDWGPGEPNGGHGESCGELVRYDAVHSHWNDVSCSTQRPMICEKPAGDGGNLGIIG